LLEAPVRQSLSRRRGLRALGGLKESIEPLVRHTNLGESDVDEGMLERDRRLERHKGGDAFVAAVRRQCGGETSEAGS
jgi:hypothetical protein